MSSDEAFGWRITDEEWREFQAIPDQGFSHRAWVDCRLQQRIEWQVERDAERIAELEAEVERLNDALDAADVRYQMLGEWGERMKAEAGRVAELEAEVEALREARVAELESEVAAWIVQADGAGKGVVKLEAEAEHLRTYAEKQDALIHRMRVRAEAAEAKITAIWHVYKDWMRVTADECSEDAEFILIDLRGALDGGDDDEQ